MKLFVSLILIIGFEISFAQSTAFLPPVPPISNPAQENPSKNESVMAPSQEPTPAEPAAEPPTQDSAFHRMPTLPRRTLSQYTGNIHFSPLSTWVPLKYGLSLGYIHNSNWTYEVEWTQKTISAGILGVDFGHVKDQRYGIQARWYPKDFNSFHLIFGLFKSEFSSEFGSSIVGNMVSTPNVKVWKLESYGPQLGFGNRWQFPYGVTLGIDWFVMYIPLFNKTSDDEALTYVNNSSDRSDVDKVTGRVQNIPQFDIFKMTLGYTF
jgi:hypothetical protein